MAIESMLELTDLKGESIVAGYEDQIDVYSWDWGMAQTAGAHKGGGSGAGRVSMQDLSFVKRVDSATHALMRACCNGKHFQRAKLTVRKAGGEPMPYLEITMEQVIISNVSTGSDTVTDGDGGEYQAENVSLNFARVAVEYTPQSATGNRQAKKTMRYDIARNVAE